MNNIIFDYYIDNGKLDHFMIKKRTKKVLIIPFYISLYSSMGFYKFVKENRDERDEFFSLMVPFFIMAGGIDCIINKPQIVPYFAFFQTYRPRYDNTNIGIFSTILMFQKNFNMDILDSFMGFTIGDYDYLKSNIYADYLELFTEKTEETLEIQLKKEYVLIAIRKYCHLIFMINFLVSINPEDERNNEFFYMKYMNLMRILSDGGFPNQFADKIITDSYDKFEKETNIYKLTAYKYIPMYLNCKKKFNYDDIFEHLKIDEIETTIKRINSI